MGFVWRRAGLLASPEGPLSSLPGRLWPYRGSSPSARALPWDIALLRERIALLPPLGNVWRAAEARTLAGAFTALLTEAQGAPSPRRRRKIWERPPSPPCRPLLEERTAASCELPARRGRPACATPLPRPPPGRRRAGREEGAVSPLPLSGRESGEGASVPLRLGAGTSRALALAERSRRAPSLKPFSSSSLEEQVSTPPPRSSPWEWWKGRGAVAAPVVTTPTPMRSPATPREFLERR